MYDMRSNMPIFGALGFPQQGQAQQQPGGALPQMPPSQGNDAMFAQILQMLGSQGMQPAPQLGGTAPNWQNIWPNAQHGPTGGQAIGDPPPVPPGQAAPPAAPPQDVGVKNPWDPIFGNPSGFGEGSWQ